MIEKTMSYHALCFRRLFFRHLSAFFCCRSVFYVNAISLFVWINFCHESNQVWCHITSSFYNFVLRINFGHKSSMMKHNFFLLSDQYFLIFKSILAFVNRLFWIYLIKDLISNQPLTQEDLIKYDAKELLFLFGFFNISCSSDFKLSLVSKWFD